MDFQSLGVGGVLVFPKISFGPAIMLIYKPKMWAALVLDRPVCATI